MAVHPDPMVRYQLCCHIFEFYEQNPEFVWATLENWIDDIGNKPGSLGVLVIPTVNQPQRYWFLRKQNRERANTLLTKLSDKANSNKKEKLQNFCGSLTAVVWVQFAEEWALARIKLFLEYPQSFSDEIGGVTHSICELLLPQETGEDNNSPEEIERLIELLTLVLQKSSASIEAYEIGLKDIPENSQPKEHPRWIKELASNFNHVSYRFRFNAEKQSAELAMQEIGPRAQNLSIWWKNSEAVLSALLASPYPNITFNLIEGIEKIAEYDYHQALHWVARITAASEPMGLTRENLAADHTIKFLEVILSEHKIDLSLGSQEHADYISILEAYLKVGWPRAIQLAINLDALYR
jgi:hypothetical protein